MKAWGNSVRLFIGLWVLAGLVVVGINAYALMSLMDEPIAGYSIGIRHAQGMFQQYRNLLNAETENMSSGMDRLIQRFAAKTTLIEPSKSADTKQSPSAVEKKVKPTAVALPVLTGIMTSRSTTGKQRRLALLNDGVFAEGDTLQDLTIRKISADGVLLAKGKKTWFLKAPAVAYSLSKP